MAGVAKRLRDRWKNWQGEDSLHAMAFAEPQEGQNDRFQPRPVQGGGLTLVSQGVPTMTVENESIVKLTTVLSRIAQSLETIAEKLAAPSIPPFPGTGTAGRAPLPKSQGSP